MPRLAALARAYPQLVRHPRATGYAFAFELPTPALLDAFLAQRFWRGAVVFAAGTHTARYRLSDSFLAREIDQLFETIRRSLSWLDAHEGPQAAKGVGGSTATAVRAREMAHPELRYRQIPHREAMEQLPAILDIEYQVYEPARRTPPAEIRAAIEDPEGSLLVAEAPSPNGAWQLVAFAIGGPLEQSKDVEGCDDDPMLGKHNTMYSVSITVAPSYQSSGIGRKLKELQLRDAAGRKRADGTQRYRYVTGRNRVGRTAQMTHLNRVFGAHVVQVMTGQYEDPEGQAIYYRIPLGALQPDPATKQDVLERRAQASDDEIELDLASGLTRPFASGPASLRDAEARGLLFGPAVNKLTLMNYVTPATVRALEWLGALVPELPHLYLTSSRDESIDKALRLIRCTRKTAHLAIGLEEGGCTTVSTVATARSLAPNPAVHQGGPAHFAWPRVPHPARAGTAATIAALRAAVSAAGIQRARLRLRAGPGTHGPGPAARLHRRAARASRRARPAVDRGGNDDAHLPLGTRRIPISGHRARARRPHVVGRRPDRLPPHLREVVHRHAAHPRVDLGRRRAVADPHAPPAARRAPPRHHERLVRARSCARLDEIRRSRRLPRDRRGPARQGSGRFLRGPRHPGSPVSQQPSGHHPRTRSDRRMRTRPGDGLDVMRTLDLPAGKSPREWGQIHGESFRGEIKALSEIRIYLCTKIGGFKQRAEVLSAASAHLPVLAAYHRGLSDELLGIAEGAGVSAEQIVVANHYTDLRDLDPDPSRWRAAPTADDPDMTVGGIVPERLGADGCSAVWAESPSGRILAQTWDMHATAIPYVMVLGVPESEAGPAARLLTVTGCLGMAGMNRARVAIAINNLYSIDATLGVVWPAMVRRALQQETAAAARDLIARSPIGSGHHYFVADRHEAYALEASGTRRRMVFAGQAPSYCHTNHCLDGDVAVRSKVPETSTTYDRMRWLEADLSRAPVRDLDDAWHRLGSEDGWPRSVCTNMATPESPHGTATCGAIAMNLETGELWAQQGLVHNVAPERWQL